MTKWRLDNKMNCRVSFKSRDYKMKQCFNLIYLSQVNVNFSSTLIILFRQCSDACYHTCPRLSWVRVIYVSAFSIRSSTPGQRLWFSCVLPGAWCIWHLLKKAMQNFNSNIFIWRCKILAMYPHSTASKISETTLRFLHGRCLTIPLLEASILDCALWISHHESFVW